MSDTPKTYTIKELIAQGIHEFRQLYNRFYYKVHLAADSKTVEKIEVYLAGRVQTFYGSDKRNELLNSEAAVFIPIPEGDEVPWPTSKANADLKELNKKPEGKRKFAYKPVDKA